MLSIFCHTIFFLILTKQRISITLLNINEYLPQNIYPITLQSGNVLKIIATWPFSSIQTNNIDLYLYSKGSQLLLTNTSIAAAINNYTVNPQILQFTINTAGDYYLRAHLQNGTFVSYQLQIYVNNSIVNSFRNNIIHQNYIFNIYSFTISNPTQIQLKYTGPSHQINITQSFLGTFIFSIDSNSSNAVQTFNFATASTYYLAVQHEISSSLSLIPFSLILVQIPCQIGFIMNTTLSNCVRICNNDSNSFLLSAPWDSNQCYCLSGFKWNAINMKCQAINRCQYDLNVNGKLICNTNGDLLKIQDNIPRGIYPVYVQTNDLLRIQVICMTTPSQCLSTVYLYNSGVNLLSNNYMLYNISYHNSIQITAWTNNTYYFRISQPSATFYLFYVQIYINNVLINSHYTQMYVQSRGWANYCVNILKPKQLLISYSGPSYLIGAFNDYQNTYTSSPFASFVGGINSTFSFNASISGTWWFFIQHNFTTSLLSISPINLTITPFPQKTLQNGYYYNTSISNYVKNCFTDPFSINANSPWDLNSCLCKIGYIWDYILSKCIIKCTTQPNSNGNIIYPSCVNTVQNILLNKQMYFPANIYPIAVNNGSNLTVNLNWSTNSNMSVTFQLYTTVNNAIAKINYLGILSNQSNNNITLTYASNHSFVYLISIQSNSSMQINQITLNIYIDSVLISKFNDYIIKRTNTSSLTVNTFQVVQPTSVNLVFDSFFVLTISGYPIYVYSPLDSVKPYISFRQSNISTVYSFDVPFPGKWTVIIDTQNSYLFVLLNYTLKITQQKCNKVTDVSSCQCNLGFYWNFTLMACVRNCINYTNSLFIFNISKFDQCQCQFKYKWNLNLLLCEFKCQNDINSLGISSLLNPSQCLCKINFYWDFNLLQCVRNCSNIINSIQSFSLQNISNCICNSGFEWDSITNQCVQIIEIKIQNLKTQNLSKTSEIIIITAFNIFSNFFKCLFLYLDDIWYYKYHRVNYPQTFKIFFNKIDFIYEFRISPWYLQSIELINKINIYNEEQQKYNNFIQPHQNNPDGIYFLNNSSEIYINNLATNIIYLILLKIIQKLLRILKNKCKPIKSVYKIVHNNLRWWNLIVMVIQGNLVVIVYQSCLQFLAPQCLSFQNKFNLVVCIFFLFGAVLYVFTFYSLIYRYEKQKVAETILNYSFYRYNSFHFQSFTFLFRIIIRGSIQGLLFQNYEKQIIALLVSDLIFAVMLIIFRNQFCHKSVFICVSLYNLIFICLDLIFTLHFKKQQIFENIDYSLAIYILMWVLATFYFLIFFCITIATIIHNYKSANNSKKNIKYKTTNNLNIDSLHNHQKQISNNTIGLSLKSNKYKQNSTTKFLQINQNLQTNLPLQFKANIQQQRNQQTKIYIPVQKTKKFTFKKNKTIHNKKQATSIVFKLFIQKSIKSENHMK